jgi:hypothetical protein
LNLIDKWPWNYNGSLDPSDPFYHIKECNGPVETVVFTPLLSWFEVIFFFMPFDKIHTTHFSETIKGGWKKGK